MQAELPEPCDLSAHMKDYEFDPVLMEVCKSVGKLMTKVREGGRVGKEGEWVRRESG